VVIWPALRVSFPSQSAWCSGLILPIECERRFPKREPVKMGLDDLLEEFNLLRDAR